MNTMIKSVCIMFSLGLICTHMPNAAMENRLASLLKQIKEEEEESKRTAELCSQVNDQLRLLQVRLQAQSQAAQAREAHLAPLQAAADQWQRLLLDTPMTPEERPRRGVKRQRPD